MLMFNADGSEGEMCGNGIRCAAKFALDKKLVAIDMYREETESIEIKVQTKRGIIKVYTIPPTDA